MLFIIKQSILLKQSMLVVKIALVMDDAWLKRTI